MKNTLYILTSVAALTLVAGCEKEFSPTSSGSAEIILSKASSAIASVNGIYRSMHKSDWSTTGNTHQAFGIPAYNIAQEAMGDDFIMQSNGNGWFWRDHCYTMKQNYTGTIYRPYDVWFGCYNWVNNANGILDYKDRMSGDKKDVDYVIGQAYAIRAYAYFILSMWYSRAPIFTLAYSKGTRGPEVEHWTEKCVPIYTTATTSKTKGRPRATIKDVYSRIGADLDSAIVKLTSGQSSTLNKHNKSYMDLYAVYLLKSRVCLAENDWKGAYDAAMEVIRSGGYSIGDESELMNGMSLLSASNVIWGADIQNPEQASAYASFYGHMDNVNGSYAKSAPKLISKTLYGKIGVNDIRRRWWDPDNKQSPYLGRKFTFSKVSSSLGDVPYMRVEEAYFNAAEATLRLNNNEGEARELLKKVMEKRDTSYKADNYSGTSLGLTTNEFTGSLLENIILQKRIEFWGEFGRVWDVRRLGQGIKRTEEDGFAPSCIKAMNDKGVDLTSTSTWDWVMFIPQAEIEANEDISSEDQNP